MSTQQISADPVQALLEAIAAYPNVDQDLRTFLLAGRVTLSPDHFARGGARDLELRDEMFGEVDDDSEGEEA